jgi:SAM-dependent methyltransferase
MTSAPTIDDPRYFDRLADVEARHWWALGMWRLESAWLDRALAGRRGLRALDVGCGAGLTALGLGRRPEISEVIGLDLSLEALRHARRQHPLVCRGSALNLPLATGRFDLVTCFDVLQHLPPGGDRRAAAELARVLAPGGVALVRSNGRGWSGDGASYRLAGLIDVIASSGLVVRRASYGNCLPSLLQEVRGRAWRGRRSDRPRPHPSGGGLAIAVPPRWINRLMSMVTTVEALLAGGLGVALPFGHSTLALAEKPENATG